MAAVKLVPKEKYKIDTNIIRMLEGYLERARAGEFTGCSVVALQANGRASYTYASLDRVKFIGMLDYVKYMALRGYDADDDTD